MCSFPTVLTDNVKNALTESLTSYRDALVNSRNIKQEKEFQFVITSVTENTVIFLPAERIVIVGSLKKLLNISG